MRKILHIDADCFYAAVETQEDPRLRGLPIAVGGSASGRGVIATCSYEARAMGVRSAMSSGQALRLCPNLKILPTRIHLYREYSQAMVEIFRQYSDCVERLSLDEAFLDVSESDRCKGSATLIAQEIRLRIAKRLGITVSAGAAPVKFLAKVASDWRKPNGLFVVPPSALQDFTAQLPLRCLPGVGPAMTAKLKRLGLERCADVRALGETEMVRIFGGIGESLFQRAWGRDERQVNPGRERKSLSVENTFEEDLVDDRDIDSALLSLRSSLDRRFQALEGAPRRRSAFVKVRFSDFSRTTSEAEFPDTPEGADALFRELVVVARRRRDLPVRLLGLGYRLRPQGFHQLALDLAMP